jgi:hypothetical protein
LCFFSQETFAKLEPVESDQESDEISDGEEGVLDLNVKDSDDQEDNDAVRLLISL